MSIPLKILISLFFLLSSVAAFAGAGVTDTSGFNRNFKRTSADIRDLLKQESNSFEEMELVRSKACNPNPSKEDIKYVEENSDYELYVKKANMYSLELQTYLKSNKLNNQKTQKANDFIAQLDDYTRKVSQLRKNVSLCIFKRELKQDIAKTMDTKSLFYLKKLENITECFEGRETTAPMDDNLFNMSKTTFDAIFKNYISKKNNLSNEDCDMLRRAYQVWSSFYELQNNKPTSEDKIPLYNVNPHNSSYFYWLKEQSRGTIPPNGLPLLHVDTHTDVGHVHAAPSNSSMFYDVDIRILSNAYKDLETDNLDKVKSKFIERLKESSDYHPQKHDRAIAWFSSASADEIKETIENETRKVVHDIAQPLTAASVSDVVSDYCMVLPPWSKRMPRSKMVGLGKNKKLSEFNVSLVKYSSNYSFAINEKDKRVFNSFGKVEESPFGVFTPENVETGKIQMQIFGKEKDYDFEVVKENVGFRVLDANNEKQEVLYETQDGEKIYSLINDPKNKLPDFSYCLEKKDFILDVDLDGFVSNGNEDKIVVSPHSFGRKKHEVEFSGGDKHGGHVFSNETDPQIEVSAMEMDLIKDRVNSFFDRLEKAKAKGYLPKVITISDSTVLARALEGQYDDSKTGGDFTPSCLAFLLNYMFREKLKTLYNVDIK